MHLFAYSSRQFSSNVQKSPGFEERYQHYQNGDFAFIGIRAEAEIVVNGVCQVITSGGLWGIESDSDLQYLAEIEHQEVDPLKAIPQSLGFSK
ncbi:MAG: hypothetical protein ABSC64_11275 [Candidatus Korobacteraceae bacterium]|jgi:membrane protein implicated in regulation of membrane protease activity